MDHAVPASPRISAAIIRSAVLAVIWQLFFAERHPLELARRFDAHRDLIKRVGLPWMTRILLQLRGFIWRASK
jgi:hypothetical protein